MHGEMQRFTALLGMQVQLEDSWLTHFPELRRRDEDHRKILLLLLLAAIVGEPYTVNRLKSELKATLDLSSNSIETRLRDLQTDRLITLSPNPTDGRSKVVIVGAQTRMRLAIMGEDIVRQMRFLHELVTKRGALPALSPPEGGFFDPYEALCAVSKPTPRDGDPDASGRARANLGAPDGAKEGRFAPNVVQLRPGMREEAHFSAPEVQRFKTSMSIRLRRALRRLLPRAGWLRMES